MTGRTLRFENIDGIIAEIERLKCGCTPTGNWSLPQACWHLNQVLTYVMAGQPAPGVTPPPDAPQRLANLLRTGKIPEGVQAPERAIPPATCSDADVAKFIETLNKFKDFQGPYPPHRIFGLMTAEQWHQSNLIHVAHHLSKLIPSAEA